MAIDKDPSIYRDRGMIGSSDELDEYGVWVKSEPQVLRSNTAAAPDPLEPSLPDIEDLPDLDLDLEMSEDLPASHSDTVHLEPMEELVPDFTDIPDFSVEDSEAASSDESAGFEEMEPLRAEREPLSEDSFTELSMDDFLDSPISEFESAVDSPMPKADAETADEPLDIDLEFSDEPASQQAESMEAEEISLEFPDVKEETASGSPSIEAVSDFDDFLVELSDSSSPTPPAVASESVESLDDMEISIGDEGSEEPIESLSDDEVSVDLSVSDGLAEIEQEVAELEDHFDDVGAVDEDLRDSDRVNSGGKVDLSTELLMRIAEELSSIKTEISSLKGELSSLRASTKVDSDASETGHESAHGFFDEEDDEKIALTGDELDNILNTADFTEEAGSDAGEELDSDSMGSDDIEFLADRPDIVIDEIALEEPSIGEIEIVEDIAVDDIPPELAELRETGVKPMTEAPEDTSYLESEEEVAAPVDLADSIDLTEAVIEEPDLGGFVLEEPLMEEPSIDSIDIDLELEDNLHTEEILLPMENKEESFEEVLPEGFVVDSEIEESAAQEESLEEEIETVDFAEDEPEIPLKEAAPAPISDAAAAVKEDGASVPQNLRQEVRAVLSYMDQLLESLPESKIEEFAKSDYYETYKKLFEELGLA